MGELGTEIGLLGRVSENKLAMLRTLLAATEINGMLKVLLHKRIIAADHLVLDAEREVELPIEPFVAMRLYNTEWSAPDWDESEDEIEVIAFDLKTGQIHCYLPLADFRRESSGGDWTEDDIRELFQDWTLQRDASVTRSTVRRRRQAPRESVRRRRPK